LISYKITYGFKDSTVQFNKYLLADDDQEAAYQAHKDAYDNSWILVDVAQVDDEPTNEENL
jgi:hypothetical protein